MSNEDAWAAIEAARVAKRRKALGTAASTGGTVGLALSGGGIRSATFSLGVLRALGKAGLIPKIDYLSTVSGGGYIGAFLCSLYVPHRLRGGGKADAAGATLPGRGDPFATEAGRMGFARLRQNGRYLLPGAGDAVRVGALMTRNWLAVQTVIGLTLLTLFMFMKPIQVSLIAAASLYASPEGWPAYLSLDRWLHGLELTRWFIASPVWLLCAACLAGALVNGASYWLTRRAATMPTGRWTRLIGPSGLGTVVVALIGLALAIAPALVAPHIRAARGAGVFLAFSAIGAVLAYGLAEWRDWRANGDAASPQMQEDHVRNILTRDLGGWTRWALIWGGVALLDSAAQTIYANANTFGGPAGWGMVATGAIPAIRRLLGLLKDKGAIARAATRFIDTIALAGGLLVAGFFGLIWAVLAHALAWRGGQIGEVSGWADGTLMGIFQLSLIEALLILLMLAIGQSWGFINLSSLATFYSARLRRAYLGATNMSHAEAVNIDDERDDISFASYYDATVLAPLHLINVTINDTASGSSNLTQRDRHGKPLVVSPAGVLYPLVDPLAVRTADAGEDLPISIWTGISGAAVSTGVGQYGGLGVSLLAGLANLRLGYWWDSGVRNKSGLGSNWVQNYLRKELLGSFPGTDGRRWYLTDGGHFENLGVYELVRRRVKFIVACDNAGDPDYEFADLSKMVRKIRIDFNAELTFLTDAELDDRLGKGTPLRHLFASMKDMTSTHDDGRVGPYAMLGDIVYDGGGHATLLLIKPRLCGAEMADLMAYAKANGSFPQQSTADQFFDEAQWESYQRLGQLIGETLFSDKLGATRGGWRPKELRPLLKP